MDNSYIPTALDEKIQSRDLQILKTALPYMPGRRQREIVTLIKSLELRKSLELIDSEDASLSALSIGTDEGSLENTMNMLGDIRQFCTDKEQERIDMLLNIFSMMTLSTQGGIG